MQSSDIAVIDFWAPWLDRVVQFAPEFGVKRLHREYPGNSIWDK